MSVEQMVQHANTSPSYFFWLIKPNSTVKCVSYCYTYIADVVIADVILTVYMYTFSYIIELENIFPSLVPLILLKIPLKPLIHLASK